MVRPGGRRGFRGNGITGWEAFEALDLVLAALALAVIATGAQALGTVGSLGGKALLPLGALLLIIVVVQIASPPPVAWGADVAVGGWLALAGSLVVLAAGVLHAARISINVDVSGRESRRRVPAVDKRPGASAPATPPPRHRRGRRPGRRDAVGRDRRAAARAHVAARRARPAGDAALQTGRREVSTEFELLRFEAAPVSATVAVVELDGAFTERAPARVRLLIERGGRGVEVPAITSGGESPWSATFAIALDDVADESTEFALAPGRGPLIALPSPSVGGGGPDDDRFLRLAREANQLRHQLGEATAAAGEVDAVRAELADARQEAEDEVTQLRARLAEIQHRAETAQSEAAAARTEREEAAKERATALDEQESLRERLRETETQLTDTERERAALRARAESADRTVADLTARAEALEQRAREAEEKVVAAEDEARISRRDLKDTRARLEAVLREQRHPGPERRGYEVADEVPTRSPTPSRTPSRSTSPTAPTSPSPTPTSRPPRTRRPTSSRRARSPRPTSPPATTSHRARPPPPRARRAS